MVHLSPEFNLAYLRGMTYIKMILFVLIFLSNKGEQAFLILRKRADTKKLIKYFLAALAVPDQDQWVNLSPYEKDRIIANDFARTTMGRDLLAEDYMLKQITASLIYPGRRDRKEILAPDLRPSTETIWDHQHSC